MSRPFRIEVEALHQGPIEVEGEFTPAELDLLDDPEYTFSDPIGYRLRAKLVGSDTVYLTGELRARGQAQCVRCLMDLKFPTTVPISLVFVQESEDTRRFPPGVEDTRIVFTGDLIYPADQLREELLVAMPSLPECELDEGDICPVRNEKVGPMVFGPVEDALVDEVPEEGPAHPKPGSWADQIARIRREIPDPPAEGESGSDS